MIASVITSSGLDCSDVGCSHGGTHRLHPRGKDAVGNDEVLDKSRIDRSAGGRHLCRDTRLFRAGEPCEARIAAATKRLRRIMLSPCGFWRPCAKGQPPNAFLKRHVVDVKVPRCAPTLLRCVVTMVEREGILAKR